MSLLPELKCDCCESNFKVSVRSSGLGPCSFAYCEVCCLVYAEPQWLINGMIEEMGGLKSVNPNLTLVFYDKLSDNYVDYWSGQLLDLKFVSSIPGSPEIVFSNRGEVQNYLETLDRAEGAK